MAINNVDLITENLAKLNSKEEVFNYLKNNIKEVKSVLNNIKPIKKVKNKKIKIISFSKFSYKITII